MESIQNLWQQVVDYPWKERIGSLWFQARNYPWAERGRALLQWLRDADFFLAGAVALGLLLLVGMMVVLRRRKAAVGLTEDGDPTGEDSHQREKVRKSIEKTLQELRRDAPQFVSLMESILKHRSIDQLLSHDEVEVAFGRLSYLQEKRRNSPRRSSSLLALTDGSSDSREKRAAMLTVVRSCYASDDLYSALDENDRRLVDRFLDSL